jgi:hypothetical protein
MDAQIFFPTSCGDYITHRANGQRYRNAFGDKRLSNQYDCLMRSMMNNQCTVVHQLSQTRKGVTGFYRFLNNPQVGLSEMISRSCLIEPGMVHLKDILVLMDGTSIGLRSKLRGGDQWGKTLGVIDDNRTPGFYINCALVIDNQRQAVLGLGDIAVYSRPKVDAGKKANYRVRVARKNLPLQAKESYVWSLNGINCHKNMPLAQSITYVMDQGGDKYESLQHLLQQTGRDFIVRSKENRMSTQSSTGVKGRLSSHLESVRWSDCHILPIRALNHYSKTNGQMVQRSARKALLRIRYTTVLLHSPSSYKGADITLSSIPLNVVEVLEDPRSVPHGEAPIHWRLLTTWDIKNTAQAWQVVQAYQSRWYIEQLFRVFKKQGMNVEHSQLKTSDAIKKQAVMALKTASDAVRLVLARDGAEFIPVESMFDEKEQSALRKINQSLKGSTLKQCNSHAENSLAWAAWIIARLGGWKGYQSQRPPGPITMKRGLEKFQNFIWAWEIVNGP